jgi:HEAT repeat protein
MSNPNRQEIPMETLKSQLYARDHNISALALKELIRLGKRSTPILIEALTVAPDPRTRRLAAEGLSEIADPTSADALFQAVHDSEGSVRARAATALNKLGDARALAALVETLDDYPDELHNPYTASMYPLMRANQEVLPLVIPLLKAADVLTRERAFLIIQAVVSRLPEGKDWQRLWERLGRYDPEAPQGDRDRSAQQWETWLTTI